MDLLPEMHEAGAAIAAVTVSGGDCRSFARPSPTKRMPLRGTVRISACCSPLSPTALRAAVMRLVSVESDTIRPPQTEAMRSSLVTTRSRFRIR